MKRNNAEEEKAPNIERWLLTYSDMITLLLALFIMLYAMSSIDAQKYEQVAKQMQEAFGGIKFFQSEDQGGGMPWDGTSLVLDSSGSSSGSGLTGDAAIKQDFQELYELLKRNIKKKGLENSIALVKGDDYISFKFRDGILFEPDSPVLIKSGSKVLKYVSDQLSKANHLIGSINISGHTADYDKVNKGKYFEWRLSTNRALNVLEYLVSQGKLPESKMTVIGKAHYEPIATNKTAEGRAINRRVEITVTRVKA